MRTGRYPACMPLSLLVATPQLSGGVFQRGVLLMLEESGQGGALGLLLNCPLGLSIAELLPEAGERAGARPAHIGGPVERAAGWCLYTQAISGGDNEHCLAPGLWLSRDREVLDALLASQEPFYLLLGYAGWSAGQLEQEEREGGWLWGEVNPEKLSELLWHTPDEQKWPAALELLGTPPENVVGGAQA